MIYTTTWGLSQKSCDDLRDSFLLQNISFGTPQSTMRFSTASFLCANAKHTEIYYFTALISADSRAGSAGKTVWY